MLTYPGRGRTNRLAVTRGLARILDTRPRMSTIELIGILTIPLFSGAIGYATNWSGVWMLFNPVTFRGIRLPGLAPLARLLPRKVQQVPGIMNGGLGWQGIIPS